MTPRLTIGLPVYNGEEFLAESLDALLGQSYEDYELVITDNASTDGTADLCRRYLAKDSRISYHRLPRNIGAAGNHNHVFTLARGELFKWASHDDLYGRTLLERCVEALDERPGLRPRALLQRHDRQPRQDHRAVRLPHPHRLGVGRGTVPRPAARLRRRRLLRRHADRGRCGG